VANLADAADIAQQTLLLACAELSACRGENLSPWLFAIARHLIVDHYRAQNRFRFVEAYWLLSPSAGDTALRPARWPAPTASRLSRRVGGRSGREHYRFWEWGRLSK